MSKKRSSKKSIRQGCTPSFESTLAKDLKQAQRFSHQGKHQDAGRLYEQILKNNVNQVDANQGLGLTYYQIDRPDLALPFFHKADRLKPSSAEIKKQLGHSLLALGQAKEAAHYYRCATAIAQQDADAFFSLGIAYYNLGDMNAAEDAYQQAITLDPQHANAYRSLTLCQKQTSNSAITEKMNSLYHNNQTSTYNRMHLAYGLGKIFEDNEQYQQAFEYINKGNQINRELTPYENKSELEYLNRLASIFDEDFFKQHRNSGINDSSPIFIVGMPRSGSSLLEQILASHPQIVGAGELKDMSLICNNLQRLTGIPFPDTAKQLKPEHLRSVAEAYLSRLRSYTENASYICDKMPHNFQYIGIIAAALPNAKIIHCRRNAMDTCASIFKLYFPGGHSYGNTQEELAEYYQAYQSLMKHWHRVLPGKIVDFCYEDLIDHPEDTLKELFTHCNILFDKACLNFQHSSRSVATASAAQVRQPLYKKAINSWTNYQEQLKPLEEILHS